MRYLLISLKLTIALTVITGVLYPLTVFALAHLLFPWQAEGSLLVRDGTVLGSALIGQDFASSGYFHGRPSAAGEHGYDASNSGGSNLGPTNKTMADNVRHRVASVLQSNPGVRVAQVPVDLVTASGSGLDPEISLAAAEIQVARVAKARNLSEEAVRKLVRQHTRQRWWGVFGEPGVNVLMVNLALDDGQTGDHR